MSSYSVLTDQPARQRQPAPPPSSVKKEAASEPAETTTPYGGQHEAPSWRALVKKFGSSESAFGHVLNLHDEACGCHHHDDGRQERNNRIWNQKKVHFLELQKASGMFLLEFLERILRLVMTSNLSAVTPVDDSEFWTHLRKVTCPDPAVLEADLEEINHLIATDLSHGFASHHPPAPTSSSGASSSAWKSDAAAPAAAGLAGHAGYAQQPGSPFNWLVPYPGEDDQGKKVSVKKWPNVSRHFSRQFRQFRPGLAFGAESGHFRYFLNFFNNNKLFFGIFHKSDNLFLHQSYLKSPTPSQINLTKNAKNPFFISETIKKTKAPSSAF